MRLPFRPNYRSSLDPKHQPGTSGGRAWLVDQRYVDANHPYHPKQPGTDQLKKDILQNILRRAQIRYPLPNLLGTGFSSGSVALCGADQSAHTL